MQKFCTCPRAIMSVLMTCYYPDLGSASDWSCHRGNLLQPIRSTSQIWVITRHQYGISALFLGRHFTGKPVVASRNVGCFSSQATNKLFKLICATVKLNPYFSSVIKKPYETQLLEEKPSFLFITSN